MHRYFIQLAYNGKDFHGWQIQPNAATVQQTLNDALSLLLSHTINVVGAGRTDTGVHASFFVAHFDLETPVNDTEKLAYKLNKILPVSIRIDKIFEVDETMHARFGALSRTYHYFFSLKKEPFLNDFTTFMPYDLDVGKMNAASAILLKHSDFTSFSKLHTDVKTNNCVIDKAEWVKRNDMLIFEVKADRFLRNMVRALVGTLVLVGRNKISTSEFEEIILKKDRGAAGASAKAGGLFLSQIEYPDEIQKQFVKTSFLCNF
jgi:tRNA pseudouridine38-40 synthase